jgi:hypothetical protein
MSKAEHISRKDLFKLHHANIKLITVVDGNSYESYSNPYPYGMKWPPSNILYYSYVVVDKIESDTYSIYKSNNIKFELNDFLSDEQLVSSIKESDLDAILLISKDYNFLIDIKSFEEKTIADWYHNNRGRISGIKYGL